MATTRFSSTQVPHTVVVNVPVARRLSPQVIDQTAQMVAARVRFLLCAEYKAQIHEQNLARLAAQELAVAELGVSA